MHYLVAGAVAGAAGSALEFLVAGPFDFAASFLASFASLLGALVAQIACFW